MSNQVTDEAHFEIHLFQTSDFGIVDLKNVELCDGNVLVPHLIVALISNGISCSKMVSIFLKKSKNIMPFKFSSK